MIFNSCKSQIAVALCVLLLCVQAMAGVGTTPTAEDRDLAAPAARLDQWIRMVPLDAGVAREMGWFKDRSGRPLSPAYRDVAPLALRDALRARAVRALTLIASGDCAPNVSVAYPGYGVSGIEAIDSELQQHFEDSFVIVEALECFAFDAPELAAILHLYTAPEFRMEAQPKIARIWERDGLSCVQTRGVPLLLKPSEACNSVTELHHADMVAQHSQVVAGGGRAGFQTIFFKESIKTFIRTPGGVALHYVNYTRSANLNGLTRRVGRIAIEDSEHRQIELLRTKLVGQLRH